MLKLELLFYIKIELLFKKLKINILNFFLLINN